MADLSVLNNAIGQAASKVAASTALSSSSASPRLSTDTAGETGRSSLDSSPPSSAVSPTIVSDAASAKPTVNVTITDMSKLNAYSGHASRPSIKRFFVLALLLLRTLV